MVADVTFEESTGIITVTRKNGSSFTIDTKLEKIAINFTYDKDTQQIILTLVDGTKQYIDLSALITQYEFLDSDTITFVVQSDGSIKAEVLDGSITERKLQPNYLAQIKVETAKSESYMNNASQSAKSSSDSANMSKSYAVGGTGTREGEDTDNAKYYYQQAKNTDVGQLRQDVDEINRNLDNLSYNDYAGGKNLFNKDTVLIGYGLHAQTGNAGQAANLNCSDYIKVEPNTTYTRSESGSTTTIVYDSSKKYISELGYSLTFTIPSNGAYIRFNITGDYLNNYSDIQFVKGTTITQNVPYIMSNKQITEEINEQNASLKTQIDRFNNLLIPPDSVTKQGCTHTVQSDGSLVVNGTPNAQYNNHNEYLLNVKKDVIYYLTVINRLDNTAAYIYKNAFEGLTISEDNGNTIFTSDRDQTIKVRVGVNYGNSYTDTVIYPCVTIIDFAKEYIPCIGGKSYSQSINELKNDLSKINVDSIYMSNGELKIKVDGTTFTFTPS